MSSFGSFILWVVFFMLLFSLFPWMALPLLLIMLVALPFYMIGAIMVAAVETKKGE